MLSECLAPCPHRVKGLLTRQSPLLMVSARRIGSEASATREALLDAAERLMLESGYAAVTSRRVASAAGLKPQLVHYYFRSMDDLFLALFRRGAERNLQRMGHFLSSQQPLRALWAFNTEPAGTKLMMEFLALANHRTSIRAEIATYAERFRMLQVEAVTSALRAGGIDPACFPPDVVVALMVSAARVLVIEESLGIRGGHAELQRAVDQWLTRIERTSAPPPPRGYSGSRRTDRGT
jgi:AcrR family transcriptional regulator